MTMHALWWWIDRWRKSTAYTDMTLEQQGAYRNLLDEAQLRGGALPDDERILAKACGDPRAWRRVRPVVLARFERRDDGWHNQTLDTVLHQSERRAKNQAAYRARLSHTTDNGADNGPDNAAAHTATNRPASPSPSPSPNIHTHPAPRRGVQGRGAHDPGSLPRDHLHHSICGPAMRVCLSVWECGVLMQQYGGPPDQQKAGVQTFVAVLEAALGADDTAGAFSDIEKNFKAWLKSIGRTPITLKPDGAKTVTDQLDEWAKT